MKPIIALAAVVLVLAAFETAWAGRCLDIPDSQIVWCDDFDNYCTANNPDNPWPGYPPTPDTICPTDQSGEPDQAFFCAHWSNVYFPPGCDCQYYHPGDPNCYEEQGPDSIDETPNSLEVVENTPDSRAPANKPQMLKLERAAASQYHEWDMTSVISTRHPGMDAVNGTDDNPLIVRLYFRNASRTNTFMINRDPLYFELRLGDDRAPTDYVSSASQGAPPWCNCASLHQVGYCDEGAEQCIGGLYDGQSCGFDWQCWDPTCGAGEQATCQDGFGAKLGQPCTEDAECGGEWVYPVVVQQELHASRIPTPHPQPPWPIHASLAVGYLAQLDNGATYGYPAVEHLCTFDGEKWYDIHSNHYPGQVGGFGGPGEYAWVTVEIKTDTYVLKMWDNRDPLLFPDSPTSSATIPRLYTGPFNKIAIGAGASCELKSEDSNDWSCKDGAERVPWSRPYPKDRVYTTKGTAGGVTWGRHVWQEGWIDTPVIYGGVYVSLNGACCLPDGSCSPLLPDQCNAAQGSYRGFGVPCDESICLGACCMGEVNGCADTKINQCPQPFVFKGIGTLCATTECPCSDPFADADLDGDVDQIDFAVFQSCFKGPAVAPTGICKCFDRTDSTGSGPPDNAVDTNDYAKFEVCASGPGVPLDPTCAN
ncbi:MAG: hypothetical protein QUV05_24505 [Phycisphaerae bacterium]|nr:hypothetical protein [Phycisphaerae bacterium]